MQFTSYEFMLFFPLVVLMTFIIPKKAREVWLLLTSLFFYMCWNATYVLLILCSIVITYVCGVFLEKASPLNRKIIMSVGLITNFSILFFYKYFNFLLESFNVILAKANAPQLNFQLNVILPVGISFYTFQAVGYMIDVYRNDIPAERNFIRYALFVSFFPQLVAGPIERSKNILSQLSAYSTKKLWNYDRIKSGIILMAWGYFLKMVIADRISIIVDEVFNRYYSYGTFILIIGAISFSLQIYCDFMSYSTIAIGAAKILDINLMDNFLTPYFALSIKEFWRRWHISLSTWFKDYLYIPLGGSRCSKIKKYRNIMITFLVSGLWHGANWTFICWGGLHGMYQILGDILEPVRNRIRTFIGTDVNTFSYKLGRVTGTYLLTVFAWIFFRAESIHSAFAYIGRMFTHFDPWVVLDQSIYELGLNYYEMRILFAGLILLICISIFQYKSKSRIDSLIMAQGKIFQALAIYSLVMIIVLFGKYGPSEELKAFLYFQF